MHLDWASMFIAAGGMAGLGKVFLIAARAMPSPSPNATYFNRWAHDFIQGLAENSDKIGKTQDPAAPIGIDRPQLTLSKVIEDVHPKGEA